MDYLSLLIDTPRLIYDYATVVEENTKEREGLTLTIQNEQALELIPVLLQINKIGEVLPLTFTNIQEGQGLVFPVKYTRGRNYSSTVTNKQDRGSSSTYFTK